MQRAQYAMGIFNWQWNNGIIYHYDQKEFSQSQWYNKHYFTVNEMLTILIVIIDTFKISIHILQLNALRGVS